MTLHFGGRPFSDKQVELLRHNVLAGDVVSSLGVLALLAENMEEYQLEDMPLPDLVRPAIDNLVTWFEDTKHLPDRLATELFISTAVEEITEGDA